MQLQRKEKSMIDSVCFLACQCIHVSDSRVLVLYTDCVAVKFKITEGLIWLEMWKDEENSMLNSKLWFLFSSVA